MMHPSHDSEPCDNLVKALHALTHVLSDAAKDNKTQFAWLVTHANLATKSDIDSLKNTIMSAISDFSAKLDAFFTRQDAAVTDLQADVQNLTDQIAALQTTQGAITPEDQALLDTIQTRASTISDKLDALNALTPPKTPATP